ncbi:uncharacterized protein [Paramisgurnus dabryanus]|uniref:uncharacterized protein n=1 Tax=Paramisgurnus dabryanus TaxID=90735 RepID=UPI0031F4651F
MPASLKKTINDRRVKDLLLRYVQLFPPVSCYLEVNVDRAIYGQDRCRSFTFLEMRQWYSLHKLGPAKRENGAGGVHLYKAVAGDEGEGHHHQVPEVLQALHSRKRESSTRFQSSCRHFQLFKALLPAAATSQLSWSNDALDDTVFLPISTSQPVFVRSPEQLPLSTSVPATADHPEQTPLRNEQEGKAQQAQEAPAVLHQQGWLVSS